MNNTESSEPEVPLGEQPVSNRWRIALRLSFVIGGSIAVWLVTWIAITKSLGLGSVALSVTIPSACVAVFGLVILRQDQTWVWPVRQMNRMLPQIRAGELPIESLAGVDGGLKELSRQVRLLLHELRRQETRVAELDMEMKQRLANRTDALERKIGSLRQQATRDALTGLFNRRALDQVLPDEIEKCRHGKANLALLMIDVDYFKILNDTLGHAAGDELLRNIGQLIRSTIREGDAAFRCGGDEFVVVLPVCDLENAEALAARLGSLVHGLTKTYRIAHQPGLSIGVSTLEQLRDPTADSLLAEADKRLYEIKATRKAIARTSGLAKAS